MSSTSVYPALVMIIRHGEKPGNPGDDKDGGPDLSMTGSARAAALPSLFSPDPAAPPAKKTVQYSCEVGGGSGSAFTGLYSATSVPAGSSIYPTPNLLIATQASSSSNRPCETITPLAEYLNTLDDPAYSGAINSQWCDKDYADVATALLQDSKTYGGQTVLICWHHGTAPDLAKALGVPHHELKAWDPWRASVFDLVFQITWDSSGKAGLVVGYQSLLFGDTASTGSAGARQGARRCDQRAKQSAWPQTQDPAAETLKVRHRVLPAILFCRARAAKNSAPR
jgi:hypothetical protein